MEFRTLYIPATDLTRFSTYWCSHNDSYWAFLRRSADALLIEAQAKHRLADEYDAAVERGDVQGHGGQVPRDLADHKLPSAADIGLRYDQIHEARQIRDAEEREPGLAERACFVEQCVSAHPVTDDRQNPARSCVAGSCHTGFKMTKIAKPERQPKAALLPALLEPPTFEFVLTPPTEQIRRARRWSRVSILVIVGVVAFAYS